jgi:energy-coupling factor transporter ATP-binding protein EcfA2
VEPEQSADQLARALAGRPGHVCLEGPNFSGRSDALKCMAGMDGHENVGDRIYIGPDVHASISTFMPTVREELDFHCKRSPVRDVIHALAQSLGLDACMENNPFTRALSGGQEVILALLGKLALNPELLACDTCLEQLSPENKQMLYNVVTSGAAGLVSLVVADNRSDDHNDARKISVASLAGRPFRGVRLPLASVNADQMRPCSRKPLDISLKEVSFRYPDSKSDALCNISAYLEGGKVYALQGNNGSGKSTWAKLLSGMLRPSKGVIQTRPCTGQNGICDPSVVAYHFQDPDLQLFETSVRNEIETGARATRDNVAQDGWGKMNLDAFGLTSVAAVHPFDLPFVVRKRLAIAATIAQGSAWIILDEPTLGQDEPTCKQLATIIRRLAEFGHGVIIISHAIGFLDSVADNHLCLTKGELRPIPPN